MARQHYQNLPARQLLKQRWMACLVMFGSNERIKNSEHHTLKLLADFGDVYALGGHYSKDYTKNSELLYYNEAFLWHFFTQMAGEQVDWLLKNLEKECGRIKPATFWQKNTQKIPLDLDIVRVCIKGRWYDVAERLPFKEHELVCMQKHCPK